MNHAGKRRSRKIRREGAEVLIIKADGAADFAEIIGAAVICRIVFCPLKRRNHQRRDNCENHDNQYEFRQIEFLLFPCHVY